MDYRTQNDEGMPRWDGKYTPPTSGIRNRDRGGNQGEMMKGAADRATLLDSANTPDVSEESSPPAVSSSVLLVACGLLLYRVRSFLGCHGPVDERCAKTGSLEPVSNRTELKNHFSSAWDNKFEL